MKLPQPLLAGIVLVPAMLTACGRNHPPEKRVPVFPTEGVVLYQGRPAVGVMIRFHPEPNRRDIPAISASTGADGTFRVGTYAEDDGMPAGNYLVSMHWLISEPLKEKEEQKGQKKEEPKDIAAVVIPPKITDKLNGDYENPRLSGLKAHIAEQPNKLEFKLR